MDTNATTPPETGDSPKKYIRTFAGDMQTFQSGGDPDLSPLVEKQSSPAERLIEASSIPPVPVSVVTPPIPIEELIVPKPEQPEEQVAPLKTYSGDFTQRMQEKHASTATVLAAEQDAAYRPSALPTPAPEPGRRSGYWLIALGVILLLAGATGAYFVYNRYLVSLTPVVITSDASAPIFVDAREQISGSDVALMQAIKASVNNPLSLNTVRVLSLAEPANGASVFTSLNVHAPDILLRNIGASGSMAGVVNTSSGQSPFFILSVGSYRATFSGMLSWERTMLTDLGPLFPLYPASASTSDTATSSPIAATITITVSRGGFRDETISNHDMRIYRDASGRSVLVYGYWDQQTLVIARDPVSFAEILGRLATSHTR